MNAQNANTETAKVFGLQTESVFAQASLQRCGHLDEYRIRHVRHVALLYMQTRFGTGGHLIRFYEEGRLVGERRLGSAKSMPLYYGLWLWHWHRELKRFSRRNPGTVAIFEHPLGAVGLSLRRSVRHVFWQWDYFPAASLVNRAFNAVARHYAPRCTAYYALTGEVIDSPADLPAAPAKIRRDPEAYFAGCRAFAAHFDCESRYQSR